MEKFVLLVFALVAALTLEAAASLPKELYPDSEEEVYRVARGIRDRKKATGECRYKKGPWEECDAATNTERRTLTLKRGDSTCEQTKVLTRKCKKAMFLTACKYEKGEWNDCETVTNTRTRTDNLKPNSDSSCQQTRTISKKCKKICRYNKQAAWSECDPSTGKKTKVLTLTGGDPSACGASKKITKPCRGGRKGGKGKQVDDEEDYEDEE